MAAATGLRTYKLDSLVVQRGGGFCLFGGTTARHASGERQKHENPFAHRANITPPRRSSWASVLLPEGSVSTGASGMRNPGNAGKMAAALLEAMWSCKRGKPATDSRAG
jgi:hypothetical protein